MIDWIIAFCGVCIVYQWNKINNLKRLNKWYENIICREYNGPLLGRINELVNDTNSFIDITPCEEEELVSLSKLIGNKEC